MICLYTSTMWVQPQPKRTGETVANIALIGLVWMCGLHQPKGNTMSSGWSLLTLAAIGLIIVVSPASVIDAIVSLGTALFVGLLAVKVLGG
jgi:hypothetical protein